MASLMSASRRSEQLSLALDEMAKAKRKAGTTLLRWKPDWEAAARHYREACKAYKLSGDTNGTIQALRESAIAHKEIESYHTAAADLEAAANLVREQNRDLALASTLYQESAQLYRLQGSSYDKAAAMLVKAGETIGESDINAGVEMMKQACAIFEDENRGVFHDATFKKAICFCISKEKYGSARSLLRRQIAIGQQHMNPFEADIYKNALSIIVLRFHTGDYETAAEELHEFEQLERFARSEECLAANELVAAWEDGDAEKFAVALKKNVFKYLLNPVAVIARKLKLPAEGAAASSGPKKPRGKKMQLDEEEQEEEGEIDLR